MFHSGLLVGSVCALVFGATHLLLIRLYTKTVMGSRTERYLYRGTGQLDLISIIFLLSYAAGKIHSEDDALISWAPAGYLFYCAWVALFAWMESRKKVKMVYLVEE